MQTNPNKSLTICERGICLTSHILTKPSESTDLGAIFEETFGFIVCYWLRRPAMFRPLIMAQMRRTNAHRGRSKWIDLVSRSQVSGIVKYSMKFLIILKGSHKCRVSFLLYSTHRSFLTFLNTWLSCAVLAKNHFDITRSFLDPSRCFHTSLWFTQHYYKMLYSFM